MTSKTTGKESNKVLFVIITPFIIIIIYTFILIVQNQTTNFPIYDKESKDIKSMSCEELRIKILNHDFVLSENEDEAIHQHVWRCEK